MQFRSGPDDCVYLVDDGAVRDFGKGGSETKFKDPADAPLVQNPGNRRYLEDLQAVSACRRRR